MVEEIRARRNSRGGFGSRAAPLLRVSYALGHFVSAAFDVEVFAEDVDVDAFADGLALAA